MTSLMSNDDDYINLDQRDAERIKTGKTIFLLKENTEKNKASNAIAGGLRYLSIQLLRLKGVALI